MFAGLGALELTLIMVIVVMLFGAGKLPEIFGAVGKGIRELRKEADADEPSVNVEQLKPRVETNVEVKKSEE